MSNFLWDMSDWIREAEARQQRQREEIERYARLRTEGKQRELAAILRKIGIEQRAQ